MTIGKKLKVGAALGLFITVGLVYSKEPAPSGAVPKRGLQREAKLKHRLSTSLPREQTDMAPVTPQELRVRRLQPSRVVRRGGLNSVQVNVDGTGMNIVGDAANEPSIAIDPTNPDRMVIAWRQFDSIKSSFRQAGIAYSHDRGLTWTATTLDPGVFRSDPVMAADTTGRFYFSSLVGDVFAVGIFISDDGGMTWSVPVNAFGGDKQWLAVDPTNSPGLNHLYQKWSSDVSCCGPNEFTRSTNQGASFSTPQLMPPPRMRWGTLDVGPDGTLYLAGAVLDVSLGHVFARSTNARNAAVTPTFDSIQGVNLGGITITGGINPAGLLGQVWLAADRSNGPTRGNIYILGTVFPFESNNITDVHFIRSRNGGSSWSEPITVNNAPNAGSWNWFASMSVAPNGRIDVTWNDTRDDPNALLSEVFYSFSLDGGQTWSPNAPVTPPWDPSVGYPQQAKIGDYYHSVSDNGGVNLAFAATFNNEEDVYFLRIPADCDGNGIEDPIDVTVGAPDCNGNQIPDSCEPIADCNLNKQQDICDIAEGTSTDCNRNNVPDDCEENNDCNKNGQRDICETADGTAPDCNGNGLPDTCDIASETSLDANGDGVPDECAGACCTCQGCLNTTFGNCRARGGDFHGLGVTCGATTCPVLPVANNACPAAIVLEPVNEQILFIDNRCATLDGPFGVNCEAQTNMASDLWYTLNSPCDGQLTLNMCEAADFDTVVAVYGGSATCSCPTNNATLLTCGDDTCGIGGGPSFVTLPVESGNCYSLRVGGWAGSMGFGNLTVTLACAGGCQSNQECDDANGCTTDRCENGSCVHENNNKPCNDGLFCTKPDRCSNGVCTGTPRVCPAGQTCDEGLDRCVAP